MFNNLNVNNCIRFLLPVMIFLFITPCTYSQVTPGDVNGDGTINIIDALLVAQYYVGLNPEGFIYENASDVNCDGQTDIIDALLIAQYYVGLIEELPECTSTPTPQPAEKEKIFGGNGGDSIQAILLTPDDGFIIAGGSSSTDIPGCTNNGGSDRYIAKLDKDKNIVWQRMTGDEGSDSFKSVALAAEGGYVAAGDSITRFDENGTELWDTWTGISGAAYSIQAIPDNGYIVAGYTSSWKIIAPTPGPEGTALPTGTPQPISISCFVTKIDDSGNVEWQEMIGGPIDDYANSIQVTPDNGFILAGFTYDNFDNDPEPDFYVVKLNALGRVQWEKQIGGSGTDVACIVHVTRDNCYLVAGYSDSTDIPGCVNNGNRDVFVVKLDASGEILWQSMVGGEMHDVASTIQSIDDTTYLVAGHSNSGNIPGCIKQGGQDCYLFELNDAGDVLWQQMFGTTGDEYIFSMQITSPDSVVLAGYTNVNDGNRDFYIIEKIYE